jgi:hypothetical protein
MHKTTLLLALLSCSGVAQAQLSIVIPLGFATAEGSTGNSFPWSSTSTSWAGLRTICIYGSANFTAQSVTGGILINRLRWRADGGASGYGGGTFATATVRLATAAVPYNAPSTNVASNFRPDLTTVYSGPVTVQTGASTVPGPWIVDIALTTPFPYDPANGGLAIDCDISNANGVVWSGGTTPGLDVDSTANTQASRVYISSQYPAANGTNYPFGNIVEVSYLPAAGSAYSLPYGAGCYSRAASFYEYFVNAAAFDLNNSSLTMIFTGTDYLVLPGLTGFVTPPASAAIVANGNDVEAPVTLGSPLPIPGGTTSALTVCSNGYVSTALGNGTRPTPSASALLHFPQTCWATWHDFDPGAGGSIRFHEVGTTSYLTWLGVADAFGGGNSTFQFQFDRSTGMVHMLWQSLSLQGSNGYLVGFHFGGSSLDPGNRDISATLANLFFAGRDILPLSLSASARPITGTAINLVTDNVPGNTPIGANLLGFTQILPGLDLGSIGMPGCSQYLGVTVSTLFLSAGGRGTNALVIPNVPAYSGMVLYSQSAALSSGVNLLGALSSNGLALTIGIR